MRVFSDDVREAILKDIFRGFDYMGISSVIREKEVKKLVKLDFQTYSSAIHGKILEYINGKYDVQMDLLPRVSTMIDEYWIYHHNIHFMIDIDDFEEVPNEDFSHLTDGSFPTDIDILVDFKYKGVSFSCTLLHTTYAIRNEETGEEYQGFGVHIAREITKDGGYKASSVLLFPEYSTKRMYNTGLNTFCMKCDRKCAVCKGVSTVTDLDERLNNIPHCREVYIVPKARQCNGTCDSSYTGFNDLTFNDLVQYIMFALNQYLGRKVQRVETIERKKIPQVKMEFTEDVDGATFNKEFSTSYTDHRFITIRDTIRYERRHGSKHSHHSSPCEHYRRGTIRHYKNGKTVEIKGTVVNKGKQSNTIYKVKEVQ